MRQFFITLSTLITLTLTTNCMINAIDTNSTVNDTLIKQTLLSEDKTVIFNNQYHYLNNSNWIINQSLTDHRFYSYDTSALKNYTFTNAKNTFLVDTTGNLVYNSQVIVPNNQKSDIENTRQEMITNRKVTTVKNGYNDYSKSQFANTDFSGSNIDWKYLQFGGVNQHIDISKQTGADKVENSNSLSETLGLYYLAKAVNENKITKALANNLGQYFFSKSSLQGQNIDKLITNIVDLIVNNNDIYNFFNKTPFSNDSTDYAISYIFDTADNIIAVQYHHYHYDKSNTSNFEYHISPGPFASVDYTGDIYLNYQDLYYLINNQNDWTTVYKYFSNNNLFDYRNMDKIIGDNWSFEDVWNGLFKNNLTQFLNSTGPKGIIVHLDCYGTDMWHPSKVSVFYLKGNSPWN